LRPLCVPWWEALVKIGLEIVLTIGLAVLVASPVSAENPGSVSQPANQPKSPDPGEIICQKQEVLGSRLATRKVCMTRSQWAESKRLDRQDTEKAQANPCLVMPSGKC
jgi:hypothetical protein